MSEPAPEPDMTAAEAALRVLDGPDRASADRSNGTVQSYLARD